MTAFPSKPVSPWRRARRTALVGLGMAIMAAAVPIGVLPGPGGAPVFALGLIIVLKNSFGARRRFIQLQRRHPKFLTPIRRLIRRDPEVVPVIWQQVLRTERMVLPTRFRFFRRTRVAMRGRRPAPVAQPAQDGSLIAPQ